MRNILIIAIEDPWPDKPQEFSFRYGFPRTGLHIASCVEAFSKGRSFQPQLLFLDHELEQMKAATEEFDEACHQIVKKALSEWHPVLICIAAPYTRLATLATRVAAHCKKFSLAPVITGGPHFSYIAAKIFKNDNHNPFDAIVQGEGESKLRHILHHLSLSDLDAAFKYPGIISRLSVERSEVGNETELHDPPPLIFDLLPREVVSHKGVVVMGGRGCIFRCSFCIEGTYWGKSQSLFSPPHVRRELETLCSEYRNPAVGLGDSLINLRSHRVPEFFANAFGDGSSLSEHFYILTRVDLLDQAGCAAFQKHGGKAIWVGIESGNQETLNRMGKRLDLQDLSPQLNIAKECGLNVGAFFIFGYPGETSQTANDSLKLIESLHRDGFLDYLDPSIFVPYPGLPMFSAPDKYKMRPVSGLWNEEDWSGWGRYNAPPVFDLDTLSGREIYAFWRRAYEMKLEIDIRDRARPRRLKDCPDV
jgi:radical SAM superfamily enzyme YgiQ (UPF0313 family)